MKEAMVVFASLTMLCVLCSCRRVAGSFSNTDFVAWLGPQESGQVLPRQAEVIRRNYDIKVAFLKGSNVRLPEKPNDIYTVTNGLYVTFSTANARSLVDVWPVHPDRTYILACISVKTGANYVGLMKVKVRITRGPLAGAIVTIKPGDFQGTEDAFWFPKDMKAPVCALYVVPRELDVGEGEQQYDLVALQYK
jgi:hypothetical protein